MRICLNKRFICGKYELLNSALSEYIRKVLRDVLFLVGISLWDTFREDFYGFLFLRRIDSKIDSGDEHSTWLLCCRIRLSK